MGFAGDSNYLLIPGNMQTFEEIPKEYANPTSAMVAGAMALTRMNRRSASDNIINALRETYRAGDRTPDMGGDMTTEQFTMSVIGRLQ